MESKVACLEPKVGTFANNVAVFQTANVSPESAHRSAITIVLWFATTLAVTESDRGSFSEADSPTHHTKIGSDTY